MTWVGRGWAPWSGPRRACCEGPSAAHPLLQHVSRWNMVVVVVVAQEGLPQSRLPASRCRVHGHALCVTH
jgi:hypothetical protein